MDSGSRQQGGGRSGTAAPARRRLRSVSPETRGPSIPLETEDQTSNPDDGERDTEVWQDASVEAASHTHGHQADIPLRGRHRLALIRDLAMGEWDPPSLARMYGLSPGQVRHFQNAYATEIQEVRAALEGTLDISTAGMWVTKKQQRLAEYQQAIEDIDETIAGLRDLGINWSRAHRDMVRARLDLYRAVADEMGAYPQRSQAPSRQGMGVHYVIDSEDAENMT